MAHRTLKSGQVFTNGRKYQTYLYDGLPANVRRCYAPNSFNLGASYVKYHGLWYNLDTFTELSYRSQTELYPQWKKLKRLLQEYVLVSDFDDQDQIIIGRFVPNGARSIY